MLNNPPNFHVMFFKLYKGLYGLKQAARAYYKWISEFLLGNGYSQGKIEKTLFIKTNGEDLLIIQVYVDDTLSDATNHVLCQEFSNLMSKEFEISMVGGPNFFLGLQIKHWQDGIVGGVH